jgi:hypothetical protein
MAGVYLGESGHVELKRHSENVPINGKVFPDDVDVAKKRFSFDFPPTAIINGDQLEIARTDGGNLELVAGHPYPDGLWYAHIDDAGGVRLYRSFREAINGEMKNAVALELPSGPQEITVRCVSRQYRCVAGITDWSLTTNREAADLTVLGEEHRRFYTNGLMSGQGSLRCFWNYETSVCDEGGRNVELPHYMAQLVLRCQLGSEFLGRFFIKNSKAAPTSGQLDTASVDDHIWWEAECVVTNVGMTFEPARPIQTSIDFITTGPICLKMGIPPSYLLQEDGALLLQEDGSRLLLEEE